MIASKRKKDQCHNAAISCPFPAVSIVPFAAKWTVPVWEIVGWF